MTEGSKALAIIASTAGTGKTTLIQALVALLKSKGYLVGTIKHSAHEVSADKEGSDSWKFTRAGSDVTVLAAAGQLVIYRAIKKPSLEEALREALKGTDIVLVEGFKEMPFPKIEIFRNGYSKELHCRNKEKRDPYLVAVASDIALDVDVPVLDLNDPEEVCQYIVDRFILPGNQNSERDQREL